MMMNQKIKVLPVQEPEESLTASMRLFSEQLQTQGYAPRSMKGIGRWVSDFVAWLGQRGIAGGDLSLDHVVQYVDDRCAGRCHRRGQAFTLRRFVALVQRDGCAAGPKLPAARTTPALRVCREFERYLLSERGLAAASIRLYGDAVGRFLDHTFGEAEVQLGQLTAGEVVRFVQTEAARLHHPKRAKVMTAALRSFLQYGRYRGEIVAELQACVPTVANWSMAGIPRTISAAQVQQLLGQCNRRSAAGRRDYAMLLLIARLGLRASEVVNLTLDDLDWNEGAIRIRGPAQRCDRLPMPVELGRALADYLRHGRPRCAVRNVFVRARAPRRGFLGPSAVSCVVCRALRRAGIDAPTKGAHLLRHSLATHMLRHGASLGEIGEILRHRNPQTTTIYAKVDLDALRTLALPWPGGVQ